MLSKQERAAADASAELKAARATTYSNIAGGDLRDYELLTTCALLDYIKQLETKIAKTKNCLVCVAIADATEVCTTAYEILNNEPDFSVTPPELKMGTGH